MSAGVKEWDSMWRGIIGLEYKAHQAWYARGRTGEGRMVLVDENLQGAQVASLAGVQFTRCDLSGARVVHVDLRYAEFIDCVFEDAGLNLSQWHGAVLKGCKFPGSWIGLADFVNTNVLRCDFSTTNFERTTWQHAEVVASRFYKANVTNQRIDTSTFRQCDFREASINRTDFKLDMAWARNSHFTDCDFRGANITGLRLNNTTFEHCKFHGIIGTPVLEGPITIVDADFSPDADGSDLRSQADIVAQWGGGTAP